jgi:hypothetical protein
MNETGGIRREYSEHETFGSLHLTMVDLQQLFTLMREAVQAINILSILRSSG